MKTLEGKVAVVTGGARDIGRAVSEKLAADGAKVVVNYFNNPEHGSETVAAIESAGGTAIAVGGDMTSKADVDKLIGEARRAYGGSIDILVNVVGGLVARKTLSEMDDDFFDKLMRLNVTSTFLTTQAAVPHMQDGSSIINFASQAGRDGGGPGASAYATSKGAVMTFTSRPSRVSPASISAGAACGRAIATTICQIMYRPTSSRPGSRAPANRSTTETGSGAKLPSAS